MASLNMPPANSNLRGLPRWLPSVGRDCPPQSECTKLATRKPQALGSPLAEPIGTMRRLAGIFAADVEGYSRLMEADEVATRDALTAHRRKRLNRKRNGPAA